MVGQLVILTSSFLRTPIPCFAYVYEDYILGDRMGYSLIALYLETHGDKTYHLSNDLGGFSDQEMKEFTIPYIDKSTEYTEVLSKLSFFKTREGRNASYIGGEHQGVKIILFRYLTEEKLISYFRDYNINQII